MRLVNTSLSSCFVVLNLFGFAFAQQSVSDLEATSSIDAFLSNNGELKQYDVLVRSNNIAELADDRFVNETIYYRIAYDSKTERFVLLYKGSRSTEKESNGEEEALKFFAGRYSNGCLEAHSSFEDFQGRKISFKDSLKYVEFPDVRLTGVASYPTSFGKKGFEFELRLASASDPGQNFKYGGFKNGFTHVFQRGEASNKAFTVQFNWFFDSATLMPNTYSQRFLSGDGVNTKDTDHLRQNIVWKEVSDVFVPEIINQSKRESEMLKSPDGITVRSPYWVESFHEFHWISANNSDFEKELFEQNLKSYADWARLIDPAAYNAFE